MALCYVAKGIFDSFSTEDLMPWDIAAGAILVSEAGGFVTLIDGKPFDPMHGSIIVAGTPELAARILEYAREADANELRILRTV